MPRRGQGGPRGHPRGRPRGSGRGGREPNNRPGPSVESVTLTHEQIESFYSESYVDSTDDSEDNDFADINDGLAHALDAAENEEGVEQDDVELSPTVRRRASHDQMVHDLESALNPQNYEPYVPPAEVSEVTVPIKDDRGRVVDNITWTTEVPQTQRGRRPANMILRPDAGKVVGPARNAATERDCFHLFFSKEILELILRETNKRISVYLETFPGREIKLVTETEVNALMGIFIGRGFYKWNYEDIDRLWNLSTSNPFFCAAMSFKRFKQLRQFICFDDQTTRAQRYKYDKLAACREMFQIFDANCGKHLIASGYLTIDECLYGMRNHWAGKSYNKDKPSK